MSPPIMQLLVSNLQQTWCLSREGQSWRPNDPEGYMAFCNQVCEMTPSTFEDRLKILHAAHAALMCIQEFKLFPLPERIQLAVIRRYTELERVLHPAPNLPPLPDLPPLRQPVSSLPLDQKLLSADELAAFKDQERLLGRKFLLSPTTDVIGMFEVVKYSRNKNRELTYEVLYEDCGDDPFDVDEEEMQKLLADSVAL